MSRKSPAIPNAKEYHVYLERCGILDILRKVTSEILERPSRASSVFVYAERRIRELGEQRRQHLFQQGLVRQRRHFPVCTTKLERHLPALAFGKELPDPEAREIFERKKRYHGPLVIRYRRPPQPTKLEKFLHSVEPKRSNRVKLLKPKPILKANSPTNEDEYVSDFEGDFDHAVVDPPNQSSVIPEEKTDIDAIPQLDSIEQDHAGMLEVPSQNPEESSSRSFNTMGISNAVQSLNQPIESSYPLQTESVESPVRSSAVENVIQSKESSDEQTEIKKALERLIGTNAEPGKLVRNSEWEKDYQKLPEKEVDDDELNSLYKPLTE